MVVFPETAGEFPDGKLRESFRVGNDTAEAAGAEFGEDEVMVHADDRKILRNFVTMFKGFGDEGAGMAVVWTENSAGTGEGADERCQCGIAFKTGAIMTAGGVHRFPGFTETAFAEHGKLEGTGPEKRGMGQAHAFEMIGGLGTDGFVIGADPADVWWEIIFDIAGGKEDDLRVLLEKPVHMFGFEDGGEHTPNFGLIRMVKHFFGSVFNNAKAQAAMVSNLPGGGFGNSPEIGKALKAEKGQWIVLAL